MPNFRKLYARSDPIKAEKLWLVIENNYDVAPWNGHKYFVIMTTNVFGSQATIIASIYIILGTLCLASVLAICVLLFLKKQKLASMKN